MSITNLYPKIFTHQLPDEINSQAYLVSSGPDPVQYFRESLISYLLVLFIVSAFGYMQYRYYKASGIHATEEMKVKYRLFQSFALSWTLVSYYGLSTATFFFLYFYWDMSLPDRIMALIIAVPDTHSTHLALTLALSLSFF